MKFRDIAHNPLPVEMMVSGPWEIIEGQWMDRVWVVEYRHALAPILRISRRINSSEKSLRLSRVRILSPSILMTLAPTPSLCSRSIELDERVAVVS